VLAAPLFAALALALALAPQAAAAAWAPVTGPTGIIDDIGQVRAPDGTLHVVWKRTTPGASTNDVLHVAISPSGAVGQPSVIASAYATANNPSIVNTPGGGLRVFFGSIQCTNQGCPSGLFTATSSDRGATWSTPSVIATGGSAYGADANAAVLADGTPFETWSGTLGVFVHPGLDPATSVSEFHGAMGAGCCGYYSNLAADRTGHMVLAWDSNATGYLGVWARAVDPATGAPVGSPLQMPGSVTNYGGQPNHAQMLTRVPIVSQNGGFFVAYSGGYPMTSKVLLWGVGSASSVTVIDERSDHNEVSLAADSTGGLWVFWASSVSGAAHVYARRVTSAGFEPVFDMGAPPGAQSIYSIDGEVNPDGHPEALALAGFSNGSAGSYYSRASLVPPPPANGKTVDVTPVSGTVLVKDAGETSFSVLTRGSQLEVGSTVDTTRGTVRLVSAKIGKGAQTADFSGGQFVVRQRKGVNLTTLALTGASKGICPGVATDTARTARAKHRRFRYLGASGTGSFSTSGRYAAATVRGTSWVTEDYCDGTVIRVRRGTVSVRDLVRRATIIVRAGQSYFAKRR
jgi:hypothetical protein